MNTRAFLLGFSVLVLAGMIGVSTWASMTIGIGESIANLLAHPSAGNNPWLIATLVDAYFGFLWFWLFIAWRETTWAMRLLWLALLLFLGNIAMAVYMMLALQKIAPGKPASDVLL